jgi:ATP-binding cassette subfamily B protein
MTEKKKTARPRRTVAYRLSSGRELLSLIWPHRLYLGGGLVALLIGSGINLIFPEVIRRLLEPARLASLSAQLPAAFLGLVALFVVQGIAFYLRSRLFGVLGQRVYSVLRTELFQAIQSQEISFFDRTRSGDLASRINSDAALIQDLVSVKISVILRYGAQVIIGTALMAYMSWRMTAAIVASVLSIVLVSVLFVRSLRAASRAYQAALASLSSFTTECFSGAKVVRALGADEETCSTFNTMSSKVLAAGERRVGISAAFSSGASLLLNVLLVCVLWFGISLVFSGDLPLNDLAAFALYGAIVAVSFSFLIGAFSDVAQALGGLDLVMELIREGRESRTRGEKLGEYLPEGPLSVEFHNISLSYPQRPEVRVLDGVSLSIKPGSVVAFMGPSGAGKSSLLQLLLNFYRPTTGSLKVADIPLSQVNEGELRSKVAWVPQEPLLFGFSIYENLVLGSQKLTRERVVATIREWGFLDFVDELPMGFDTVLGEHGSHLSGGQRQRLAIARALLRRPAILLLDEATSALDSELEDKILSVIHRTLPQATVLLISHRVTSARHADRIVVMSEGRILEQGTHAELTDRDGLYRLYSERQRVAV